MTTGKKRARDDEETAWGPSPAASLHGSSRGGSGASSHRRLPGSGVSGLGGTSHYGSRPAEEGCGATPAAAAERPTMDPKEEMKKHSGNQHIGQAGAVLGGAASHYSTSSFQHESYCPPADNVDLQSHHYRVSIYGTDPSLVAGFNTEASAASASPASFIKEVMQKIQSYTDAMIGTVGANFDYIRTSSEATLTIQGASGGMTIEIHATSPQVQAT